MHLIITVTDILPSICVRTLVIVLLSLKSQTIKLSNHVFQSDYKVNPVHEWKHKVSCIFLLEIKSHFV